VSKQRQEENPKKKGGKKIYHRKARQATMHVSAAAVKFNRLAR